MATFGYPGVFPAGLTTGYRIIGAVQKQVSGALGYPGVFPAALTTGYTTIGAVQKDVTVAGGFLPKSLFLNQTINRANTY